MTYNNSKEFIKELKRSLYNGLFTKISTLDNVRTIEEIIIDYKDEYDFKIQTTIPTEELVGYKSKLNFYKKIFVEITPFLSNDNQIEFKFKKQYTKLLALESSEVNYEN